MANLAVQWVNLASMVEIMIVQNAELFGWLIWSSVQFHKGKGTGTCNVVEIVIVQMIQISHISFVKIIIQQSTEILCSDDLVKLQLWWFPVLLN